MIVAAQPLDPPWVGGYGPAIPIAVTSVHHISCGSPIWSGPAGRHQEGAAMQRTSVNPWPWSLGFAFNQAELVEGHRRVLVCSGQTATDADGQPQHPGDMAAQLAMAADNLQAVLAAGGMGLADVVRLQVYTTDVDRLLEHYQVLVGRLEAAGVRPPSTLLGVARLAAPELLVELEATALA
jgi:enamine deaminase RidA (YjgF/YER057c/UK114 family)